MQVIHANNIRSIIVYLFFKFSKKATLFFSMPGTKTGLGGRSGLVRPISLFDVECLEAKATVKARQKINRNVINEELPKFFSEFG